MPPFSLKLKSTVNKVLTDSQSELPNWMPAISVIAGFLLLAIFIAERNSFIGSFGPEYRRITISGGLALIMCGVGSQVSGKWGQWHLVGAAGLTIVFYTLLVWMPGQQPEPAMVARVSGFPENVNMVQASDDGGEQLFVINQPNGKEFKFRTEESHLKKGCIDLVMSVKNDVEYVSRVHTSNLKKVHSYYQTLNQDVELTIFLPPSKGGFAELSYLDGEKMVLISTPDPLSCRVRKMESVAQYTSYALPLFLQVRADSSNTSAENLLIEGIRSDDFLRRYDAQKILSTHPTKVISTILNVLQNSATPSDEKEFLETGLVGVIGGMLRRGVDPNEIKKMLREERDLEPLVRTLRHRNQIYSLTAMSSLMQLRDKRVNKLLLNILKENEEEENNGKYYAAVVLSDGFSTLSENNRKRLSKEVSTIVGLDARTQSLLDSVVNIASVPNETPLKMDDGPIGWVYIGINFDDQWEEKYFDWNIDSSLPETGVTMMANGSVHLRKDHIKFDSNTSRWINADIVGLVHPGDKVKVIRTKNVAGGFYWAEIAPAN